MKLHSLTGVALTGLKTNKTRSALTILGIVIGVTAIIMVVSLGQGARDLIVGQIEGLGSRLIAVIPGRQPTGPADVIATLTASLTKRDLDALQNKARVSYAEFVIPIVFGNETIEYEGRIYRPTIFGGNEYMADVYDAYPEYGRNVSPDEIRSAAAVVILGATVAEKLAPEHSLLGKRVKIKGKNFLVIGVREKLGSFSLINFDDSAFVPYTTAQQYIFGAKHFHRFAIQADSEDHVGATVRDVERTLREMHGITDPEKDDFWIQTQADALQSVNTVLSALTVFLALVAAISLLVGGVGIMNIMLVSVTERTREIGLRKALGATNSNILTQFLIEAIILTGIGGIIGIVLGALLSFGISTVITNVFGLAWTFTFPLSAALVGIIVSSAVGLIFGLYPARKASQMNPIDALRYE